jgi:hypothetical protein
VTGKLDGKRVRVAAASGAVRRNAPDRGGILGATARLAAWPVEVPARIPGRMPLPGAADRE